eukprot:1161325-Pelagomonas_calceolata.AAC.29
MIDSSALSDAAHSCTHLAAWQYAPLTAAVAPLRQPHHAPHHSHSPGGRSLRRAAPGPCQACAAVQQGA